MPRSRLPSASSSIASKYCSSTSGGGVRGGARAAAPSPYSRSKVDIAAITQVRLPYGCPHASRWGRATSRGAWKDWVGWVPQKQASVTQCSVFSIALGATRMPSGHVCTPCTDARRPHADRPTPYVRPARSARRAMAALWPHVRAFGPPVVRVAALTRRAHPLKTPGAMPGKSLEAHRCDITRPLPLRTIVSCLSMSPMPAAHAAAQPNLRIAC